MQFPHRYRVAIFVFGLFLTAFSAATAFAIEEPEGNKTDAPPAIVLKDATIHSVGPEGTFVGSIVIVDGKIEAVGPDVESPKAATVYELKGFHVTPGLIESRGKLWLTDQAIAEKNSKAELNVVDAIDPWDENWKELAAQGVTSVYVQPSSLGTVGGLGAVLRVGPHGSVDDIVMKDQIAVQISIGIQGRTSKDRFAQIQALEKLLKSAQDKKKDEKKEGDEKEEKKEGDKESETENDDSDDEDEEKEDADEDKKDDKKDDDEDKDEEKKDVTKEIFKRVLKREIPLFVEVHHSDALRRVIALAKEFKIRVVLDGLSKVERCVDELEDCSHAMVIGPFFEPGDAPEYRKDGDFEWFAKLNANEKLWSFSAFPATARGSQSLRINAAHAVQSGIDSSEALKALTANAARILGVSDHVGTIEAGKEADIAVFAGDPMNSSTPARLVISHGKVIFESDMASVPASEIGDATALPDRLPKSYVVKTSRMLRAGKLAPGTIVVTDGKISTTDPDKAQKDIQVYDLGDTIVTPGLVIAHSSLGQAATINDPMESDASHLRAVDAFDPTTKQAKETLSAGFIHVGLAPGTSNTSSGAMGHVRLGTGDYVVAPTIANQFVFSGSARSDDRFPASLNGQVRLIGDLFLGNAQASNVYLSDAVSQSITTEKLDCVKEVANGKRKSIFIADDNVEIRSAIRVAKKNQLSPALASKGSIGDLAELIVESRMGLIIAPIGVADTNRYTLQTKTAVSAGIPISFIGDSAMDVRTTASMLAAAGVPADKILSGMTVGGGELVGMSDIGLARGANADFVVWSDTPLNLAAKPLNVIVGGMPVSNK